MHTTTVGLAVTPTVVSTLVSHYLNRKPLAHKPTERLSYDQGLHLIRSFLAHASRHTVEEVQDFTSQWVPHPQWVKVDRVEIPEKDLLQAADLLAAQLGPDGIRQVGGKEWWQWRKPKSPLKAEWIEMKADYQARKKNSDLGNRIMLYVHGGAYYFGSVDEHRYQIQRHARKLKARALAPRYRLAPQFPFPCGLQDCLATYLYLITHENPSTIILAGDSAGAGMIVSMMVILRDRGIPLPAGAVLISPWVDLAHSFPSVAEDCPMDYIPASGFHHKPSPAWPPPDREELEELREAAAAQIKDAREREGQPREGIGLPTPEVVPSATDLLTFVHDGEEIVMKEQIQMYTTNELLSHPLVSPILQPTLGGLPPLLIMVGGGEMLRDEQIYLAHKCTDPAQYLPPEDLMDEKARALVERYKPTDVQLQVWDDLCHVGPTLSFTKPAKYMYRSVAQFSAWALSRAQKIDVDIVNDGEISVISVSTTSSTTDEETPKLPSPTTTTTTPTEEPPHHPTAVGKAGDPLPPFQNHMIRQRVTRHGGLLPLAPQSDLPGCCVPRHRIGAINPATLHRWTDHRSRWDLRFKSAKAAVQKQRMRDLAAGGYELVGSEEAPPPSALAGRRRRDGKGVEGRKRVKGVGLAIWSLWGSKHDKMSVRREEGVLGRMPGVVVAGGGGEEGEGLGARHFSDLERQVKAVSDHHHHHGWRGLGGRDGGQVGEEGPPANRGDEKTAEPAAAGLSSPPDDALDEQTAEPNAAGLLSPDDAFETGVTGKRAIIGGVATPFSLRKEPETASMITLAPSADGRSTRPSTAGSSSAVPAVTVAVAEDPRAVDSVGPEDGKSRDQDGVTPGFATPFMTPFLSPMSLSERPGLERFVTAEEEAPKASE